MRLAFAAAPGRCSLVTDAVAAAGLADGAYRLGEVEIEVEAGSPGAPTACSRAAPRASPRASSGSARSASIRGHAMAAVTARPASLLGVRLRRLEQGGRADVLVVDDELRLQRVIASGIEIGRSP